jgi:ABC-2 type transport system ATP-binding protein
MLDLPLADLLDPPALDGGALDAGATADAMISARGLGRTFKGGIDAVRGVDLTVRAGEVFGFLGPNGAGKTTTVRMLCTLLPPTSGSATVARHEVVEDPGAVRRRIGVALQEIGLDPVQTGRELLELQCGLYGITGAINVARPSLDDVFLLATGRRLEGRKANDDAQEA